MARQARRRQISRIRRRRELSPDLSAEQLEQLAELCRLTGSKLHTTVLERWAKGETLKAIAVDLRLSETRISQVRTDAIERLRQRFAFRP